MSDHLVCLDRATAGSRSAGRRQVPAITVLSEGACSACGCLCALGSTGVCTAGGQVQYPLVTIRRPRCGV
ncbi:hypothetical protein [Streptosporangium sp. NPDC000396]|uniref:hypothetical protein n=1 Tax=Streptosporangium sp. NPDC000396 TaxID=3366185 RepID=UPI0036B6D08B